MVASVWMNDYTTRIQDISKEKKTMSENEITMVDSTSCAVHCGMSNKVARSPPSRSQTTTREEYRNRRYHCRS